MATSRREIRRHGFSFTPDLTPMTRIAVVGSRETFIGAREAVYSALDQLRTDWLYGEPFVVVTGGARGFDTLGMDYARERGLPLDIYWPLWNELGKRAGFVRNQDIVDHADLVLAWPLTSGRGTQLTIEIARRTETPCITFPFSI